MKKIITPLHGDKIEVRTDGALFGFMADDIITDESANGCWRNKRIIVEGFRKGCLWGTVEGKKFSMCSISSNHLILLERPGWKFKIGDEVKATIGSEVEIGRIIVIDPYQEDQVFLAEFKNFIDGHDGSASWERPWYPNQHKTKLDSRWWVAEDDLKFFVEKAPHKKVIWREKPDLREAT